jgi:hypothetical protein
VSPSTPPESWDRWVRGTLRASGRDGRTVYWRWIPPRGRSGRWGLETDDEVLLARLDAREGGAPRARARRLPARRARLLVITPTADLRFAPDHGAERVNEYILGDLAVPLRRRKGWWLVRGPDGYIGWLREWFARRLEAGEGERARSAHDAQVAVPFARLRSAGGRETGPHLVLGTPVRRLESSGGRWRVRAPDGRTGHLQAHELRSLPRSGVARARDLIRTARDLIGVPYLWGGTTPKGFDCSGYLQRVFGVHGVELPRDSDQQARAGRPVRDGRAGDLCFFGGRRIDHVGLCVGGGRFLHCQGTVRDSSLLPGHRLYHERLARRLRGFRRFSGARPGASEA